MGAFMGDSSDSRTQTQVQQRQQKMQSSILFAFCLVLAAVSGKQTCDECTDFGDRFVKVMTSEDSLVKQVDLLTVVLCPMGPEGFDACAEQMKDNWPVIANLLVPKFLVPLELCKYWGWCPRSQARQQLNKMPLPTELSCNDCQSDVYSAVSFLMQKDRLEEMINVLKGEEFCGTNEDPAKCQDVVQKVLPFALETHRRYHQTICHNCVFYAEYHIH